MTAEGEAERPVAVIVAVIVAVKQQRESCPRMDLGKGQCTITYSTHTSDC